MSASQDETPLSLLQQLDLHLTCRIVDHGNTLPAVEDLTHGHGLPPSPEQDLPNWISAVLGLRGLLVHPDDVAAVLKGHSSRYHEHHHERRMILGLSRVHARLLAAAAEGRAPDGWWLAELFREFSRGVARFRNNVLRRDLPWDSILYVRYPDAGRVRDLLDGFTRDASYGDNELRFRSLHPVRQSFRVLWQFARIAPFPDFNLVMAFLGMSAYLLYSGYPIFSPDPEDRALLHRIVTGPVPNRVMRFESRLLKMSIEQPSSSD